MLTFFAIVFGTTWPLQVPAILAQRGYLAGPVAPWLPLVVLGYFVPTIAALVLSRHDLAGSGVRTLLHGFVVYRVAPGWYLLALAHSAAVLMAATTLARLVTGATIGHPLYPPTALAQIAAMCAVPLSEQIAWRGFAYPPLERRLGPLGASLVVGAAWALFHVQKQSLLAPGLAPDVALWMVLLMTSGTVVFTWFYRRTGSMLVVVVANAGVYLDNPTYALPVDTAPLAADAVGYCATALLLVLADRSVWSSRSLRSLVVAP